MTKEEIQKNSEHWYNKYKELEAQLQKKINITTVSDYPYSALKLEEAKEIMQELIHEISVFYIATDRTVVSPTVKQAELFLKEVEK